MANQWLSRIRKTKQLKVHNKASAWSGPFNDAIKSFNLLSFGVKLVVESTEKKADVVLVLANGPTQYTYQGHVVKTGSSFKADSLHGYTLTLSDFKTKEILFAVIFLPGKIRKLSKQQKEMVVVHELLHACGHVGHDIEGIMTSPMQKSGSGILEYLVPKGAKPMPPIRVGKKTASIMRKIWP